MAGGETDVGNIKSGDGSQTQKHFTQTHSVRRSLEKGMLPFLLL